MPELEGDRLPHLPLTLREENPDRRRRPAPPVPPPPNSGRREFATQVQNAITRVESDYAQRPAAAKSFDPSLVFRVSLAPKSPQRAVADRLERLNVRVVSHEADNAIIAFQGQSDLAEFKAAMQAYAEGPRVRTDGTLAKSTINDVFEHVLPQEMRSWTRADRVGARLSESIGPDGRQIDPSGEYVLDVDLWPVSPQECGAFLRKAEQRRSPDQDGIRITDRYISDGLAIARVRVRGADLDLLLESPHVSEIELPPHAELNRVEAVQADLEQFAIEDSPIRSGVCVIDSGVTSNHPFLVKHFGHGEAVLTSTETAADENGHGTFVGGIAVFGDVRGCYTNKVFTSPIRLFSARVLNSQNRFDDERLIESQMRQAIETFTAQPYSCRVFNLSIGSTEPAESLTRGRQSRWAQAIDDLVHEFDVVIVVSAGNAARSAMNSDGAEYLLSEYPKYIFEEDARLCDPATAALAVTVGSIAQFAAGAARQAVFEGDVERPIAHPGQPSPFTRTGLGHLSAIKPEFVHYGGNLLFEGTANSRQVRGENPNPGVAAMSFNHEPSRSLFAFRVGTSFAAPQVANLAARLIPELEAYLDQEPTANLVRAVIASSAEVPRPSVDLLADEDLVIRACGYGMPRDAPALWSEQKRVVLLHQGHVPIDTYQIFELPIPAEFVSAPGRKRIVVSLAFDPPVRRRRANEYLTVEMTTNLFRGRNPQEIVEAYRAVTAAERDTAPRSINDSTKCTMLPTNSALADSTLHRRTFTFSRTNKDYGDTYYLLLGAIGKFPPSDHERQGYGLAVTLEANDPQLYSRVRSRVQLRARARV